MAKPDIFDKYKSRVDSEIDQRTTRMAKSLQGEYSVGDAQDTPTADWHRIIRDNWQDPVWRQAHAQQVGAVKLVNDAMDAFGLDKSALKDAGMGKP